MQNARSQYDTVLANEVTARNNLDNMVEALRQVALLERGLQRTSATLVDKQGLQ